jgi:hypothetical protein
MLKKVSQISKIYGEVKLCDLFNVVCIHAHMVTPTHTFGVKVCV